ncbi:MAG TPA: hypothetical protein DCW52_00990 [Gammaproteobacteria bacterium]|nr:hypothetical protein [Gammaproteobacteria bacterium]
MRFINKLLIASLLTVGVINLVPVFGLFSSAHLNKAYGVAISDPNMEILLRHRALLFGVLGGFVLASIVVPEWRLVALMMAGISMASFLLLVFRYDNNNVHLLKIAYVDIVGLVVWALAMACVFESSRATQAIQ